MPGAGGGGGIPLLLKQLAADTTQLLAAPLCAGLATVPAQRVPDAAPGGLYPCAVHPNQVLMPVHKCVHEATHARRIGML
jgi:hypothetical protein